VRGEPEVRVHVREDLRQVAGLPVVRVIVQQHHRRPGWLKRPQQPGQQQRVAPVQVDVPVPVPDVELDRPPEVGAAPDEEAVQHLVGQPRRRPVGPAGTTALVRTGEPARHGGGDLRVGRPPPVKLEADPVRRDRFKANDGASKRWRADPLAQFLPVGVGEVGGAHSRPRQ
jgi:hypothetical protein